MKRSFHIHLKAGEKLYINGAVLRADRKVSLEFLNDVRFLLEAHVMQADATTTPLRQLYFIVQTILMDPANSASIMRLFLDHYSAVMAVLENRELRQSLQSVRALVEGGSTFEALKVLRGLFPAEAALLGVAPVQALPGKMVVKEAASCR